MNSYWEQLRIQRWDDHRYYHHSRINQSLHDVGMAWFYIGIGGLVFRTVHLFFLRDMSTGLVWMCKIITDPVHDILLYWRSPIALLRGELIDPMDHVQAH